MRFKQQTIKPSKCQVEVMRKLVGGWRLPFPECRLRNGSRRARCSIDTVIAMTHAGWIAKVNKEEWHKPPKGMTREEWGEVYRWQEFELTPLGRRTIATINRRQPATP